MPRTPQWPPIKERRNRGGSLSFVLECGFISLPGGGRKRIRHYFKTREEAEKEGRELRAVRREHGQKAALARVVALTGLDDCLPLLYARGLTVKDAVQLAVQPKPNSSQDDDAGRSQILENPTGKFYGNSAEPDTGSRK